jgi:hypothetical protein
MLRRRLAGGGAAAAAGRPGDVVVDGWYVPEQSRKVKT